MTRDHELTNLPTVVRAELIDDSSRLAPQQSLEDAAEKIQFQRGLSALLQPKERRLIATRLQDLQNTEVVNLGIMRLRKEADAKIIEIELSSERTRASILEAQNEQMGELKCKQAALAADAIRSEIEAEHRRQRNLTSSDLLDEDREMLAELYKHRSLANIDRIAREHGVQPRRLERDEAD